MIGKEILNYRILSLIGKGGMGSVYLAEHTLIKNEKVAIKVINSSMANSFTQQLLNDEAEHLAGLNHPNIVSFKNYHVDQNGNIYLIMEYADGKSLEDYIKNVNGLIVEERICPIFEPILDAVGYAHKKKILHRDIKPANVVITTEGVPKILDFGIAKIIKGEDEGGDNLVMGTPSYMSPEQVKGEHLDERSDVYSLGVLLHHMLTGNPPYDTTTLTEAEINTKVVEEELPRMKTYYKYVSEKVQKVVDKATAKNPKDRYSNCEDFKKALHRAVYPWRMKTWMKVAAVAAVLLVGVAGWQIWDYNRVKIAFYKDYVERWGVPEGVGELSSSEVSHLHRMYRFESSKGKVRRVSHVNSLGVIISDGESERTERPLDQEITYTPEGKVSRIKVRDHNGKVLYVKSFNEKLSTMSFQYDDEHNTERALAAQSIGYGRFLEDNSAQKGKITKWFLEYDEEGFTTSIKYAGLDGSPVGDENNIYGRIMKHDKSGRITEIKYIGQNGNPQPTRWGMGIKRFYYDDKDNWVRAVYYTVDDKPAYDDFDGVGIYEMQYDDNGNMSYAWHKDGDGALMIPKKNGVAGVKYEYDDKGFIKKITTLGADGKAEYTAGEGQAGYITKCDENGFFCEQVFIDPDGKPCENSFGISKYTMKNDSHGNLLERWSYNIDGNLTEGNAGYAGEKSDYDSLGNVIRWVIYGTDRKPIENEDGVCGLELKYDERGLTILRKYLGADLKPCYNNNHVCIAVYDYDKRGNTTRIAFYDQEQKKLECSDENVAGWNLKYDDNGNEVERVFFNEKDEICEVDGGYARLVRTYDEHGHLASDRYYNVNGQLVKVGNSAGNDYVNDVRGNTLVHMPIGPDGNQAAGLLETRYKYDKYDNVTEIAYFDHGAAVVNYDNIHKTVKAYDSRNQEIEAKYYGVDGNLTLSKKDGIAILRNEFDQKGNRVKAYYYGTDSKPIESKEGWASSTYEYNAFGYVTKQCFFDIKGGPTNPAKMVPVGICKYDARNNMTYIAALDGKGNYIINPNTGWAICRREYDKKSQQTMEAYYDEHDKPTLCEDGHHKKTYVYDKHGNVIEEATFGKDLKPSAMYGVHIIKYKYDEHGNQTHLMVYGTDGKPSNCNAGFHKIITEYNDNKVPTVKKYYALNGSLIATQKYDPLTGSWKDVSPTSSSSGNSGTSSGSGWQEDLREAAQECPIEVSDGLVLQNISYTSNSVTLSFKLTDISKYDINDEDLESLRTTVEDLRSQLKDALGLPRSVSVYVKLLDKANRAL